jgi:hypothetical protein
LDINYPHSIINISKATTAPFKNARRVQVINWKNLAGEKRYRQGTMIINENGRIILGRVDSVAYDGSSGMTTLNLGKVVVAAEGNQKTDAVTMDRFNFKADESFPLQIENGAVKFVIYPFGDRGVLLPQGVFMIQSILDAAGIGNLNVPFGAID